MAMEVYVSKQSEGPYHLETEPLHVVDRLCKVMQSIDLAHELLEEHKLTMIGAINKNRTEIPLEFLQSNRVAGSSVYGFSEHCTLVFYTPKLSENILLISTMHDDASINETTKEPEIILSYNSSKGGVDAVGKLSASYDCARETNRWPMVVFYSLLNICGIHAFEIYCENNKDSKRNRKNFIEKLAYEMMDDHLKMRAIYMYVFTKIDKGKVT